MAEPPMSTTSTQGLGMDDRKGATDRARSFTREQARTLAEETHIGDRAAQRVNQYATAVSHFGDEIEKEGGRRVGQYMHQIADRLDQVAEHVRTGDYRGAVQSWRLFARDYPEVYLGSMFALGAFVGHVARAYMAGDDLQSVVGSPGGNGKTQAQGTHGAGMPMQAERAP